MIQLKSTSTLLFAVLLTGWVHFASSRPPFTQHEEYNEFLHLLGQDVNTASPDALSVVIQNLGQTSDDFKELCLRYVDEQVLIPGSTPAMALTKAIKHIFGNYVHSARKSDRLVRILENIESTDPIGFNVYLMQQNIRLSKKSPSRRSKQAITDFEAAMKQRVRLLNMKTDNSCFDTFGGSSSSATSDFFSPDSIPFTARNELATEYGPLSEVSIDLFTDLSRTMYRIGTDNVHKYRTHNPSDIDDVQILYGTSSGQTDDQTTLHPICIWYESSTKIVHVYDSLARNELDHRQDATIQKLYPFKSNEIFEQPKTVQDKSRPTGAIFAVMYASMLLLGENPARTPINLNTVYGDETVYMRIHILNMLANRKLARLQ